MGKDNPGCRGMTGPGRPGAEGQPQLCQNRGKPGPGGRGMPATLQLGVRLSGPCGAETWLDRGRARHAAR